MTSRRRNGVGLMVIVMMMLIMRMKMKMMMAIKSGWLVGVSGAGWAACFSISSRCAQSLVAACLLK